MIPRNTTALNLPLSGISPAPSPSSTQTPRTSAQYSSLSKGFVDVGEEKGDVSNYPLKRTRSASSFESEEQAYQFYKQLELKVGLLQRELIGLRQKLDIVEEGMGKTQWGVKYSRRGTIVANLLLGLWIFWSRFIKRLQRRKTSLLQNVIGMSQLQRADNTFNQFLYETWLFSFGKSWVFFLATLLLTSSQDWKRNLGITISSGASVWFAFRKEFLPWTHYFNLFSNMLYVSAKWATSKTNFGTKTIKDYIGPNPNVDLSSPRGGHDESSKESDPNDIFCIGLSEDPSAAQQRRKSTHTHRRSSSDLAGTFLTAPLERRMGASMPNRSTNASSPQKKNSPP